jgi:osmoprotectant transport system substrate-binding protein
MGMYRTVRREVLSVVAFAATALCTVTLVGCSGQFDHAGEGPGAGVEITIGAPAVEEGRLLAEIYGQALADKSFEVSYNFGAGNRSQYLSAMQSGAIDLVPDYSLSVLTHLSPSSPERSAVDVNFAVEDELALLGLYAVAPTEAQNGRAFVVTREFAEAQGVASIADLGSISSELIIGGTKEYERSDAGRAVLKKMYAIAGWRLKVLDTSDPQVAVDALVSGEIDVAVLPAASKYLVPHDLVALTDPSLLFRVNNVIPIVTSEVDTRPIVNVVDAVSEKLTTDALRDLITRQANERAPGDAVIAHDWLVRNGLVEP